MVEVAVVGYGQMPSVRSTEITETQMVLEVTHQAVAMAGIDRHDIGFTVSGSCDYLAGQTFAFVQTLEAAGAWPPISESHVEMDGAWALYEAWVRLQHGDVDVALVFASGRASLGVSLRETLTFQLDPYYLAPIGADYVSLAALQAQAVLEKTGKTEQDLAAIVAERRRDADGSPNSAVPGDATADDLMKNDYVV